MILCSGCRLKHSHGLSGFVLNGEVPTNIDSRGLKYESGTLSDPCTEDTWNLRIL